MDERSPNSEPDGSRRARHRATAGYRAPAIALVFDRPSRLVRGIGPVPEARLVRADWMFGNREARPGLR
jgi:hypothetical protein